MGKEKKDILLLLAIFLRKMENEWRERKGGKDVLAGYMLLFEFERYPFALYVLIQNVYIAIHHHEPVLDANQAPDRLNC